MVEQVHQQASRMGALRAIALCRCFSGALHFQNGKWSRASADLREAIDLYRGVGGASGESLSLQRYGVLLTAQGNLDEAMSMMEEGVAVAERATMRSHCLTRLYASMARNRLAASDLRNAMEYVRIGELTAQRHGHCVTCNALLLPEAVRARIAVGDHDGARRNATELDLIAADFGSAAWRAMARHADGRSSAAEGRWEQAAVALLDAATAYRNIRAPYDAARALAAAAVALERGGDRQRGASLAAESAALFREIGAPGIES